MERAFSRFEFGRQERIERACESPGCAGEGLYRAPKSPNQLRDYRWFCLEHVREYNKAWNFCSGFSQSEIESMIRSDTTWERQTRPMAHWAAHEQRLNAAAQAFATGETQRASWRQAEKPRPPDTPEAAALRVLDLAPPVDYATIRARYIELVKINHPDANGGDKASEERLKTINQALQTLKAAYLA